MDARDDGIDEAYHHAHDQKDSDGDECHCQQRVPRREAVLIHAVEWLECEGGGRVVRVVENSMCAVLTT